ncbi:MAG: hypothetical protein ACUVXF_04310 [Desulfobaccales bacterium]
MNITAKKMAVVVWLVLLGVGGLPHPGQAQPVHFKELMAFLALEPPKGWEVAQKPRGTTMKAPVQMSEAEVEFRAGDKSVEIKILDALGRMLPFPALTQALELESNEEHLKSIEIQGFKGYESYKHESKEGEITLVVANRFLVTITGHGMEDTAVLKEMAAKLDLKKLAALAQKGQ